MYLQVELLIIYHHTQFILSRLIPWVLPFPHVLPSVYVQNAMYIDDMLCAMHYIWYLQITY
jgi:hypothetical protein